jgi:hypothetical protein
VPIDLWDHKLEQKSWVHDQLDQVSYQLLPEWI